MRFEIKNLAELQNAAQAFCSLLQKHEIPQEKVFDCRLIVNELVGNVLRHSDGTATLTAIIQKSNIEICIRSTKAFFPPETSVCPPASAESGRGLFLVDSVSISRVISSDGEIKVIVEY